MTGRPHPPPARDDAAALALRIDRALAEAVREALLHHKRAGNSVAVWSNGRVEWIPPENIRIPEPPVDAPGLLQADEVREPDPDRP
ncbi:MAG: hypothetical protein HUU06_08230 [Planctomycetaceae bacterium]|nr:hypothetical protein [Planctomycetota bacterium]NUN52757.1 hypothetical protein [Planctomycetaceae bacterium]